MTDFALRRRMMVDTQVRPSDVTKFPIIDAMLSVPREIFVPSAAQEAAYAGEHIVVGRNRVILDPRTFAKMIDALDFDGGELVLDVGGWLGYSAAVIARMTEAVVMVEADEGAATEAASLLADVGADAVIVHQGALQDGAAEHGPYDAILIEGGVEKLPPALADQLKEGGRIACLFMEGALGAVRIGHKIDGAITWRFAFNAGAPVLPGFAGDTVFAL